MWSSTTFEEALDRRRLPCSAAVGVNVVVAGGTTITEPFVPVVFEKAHVSHGPRASSNVKAPRGWPRFPAIEGPLLPTGRRDILGVVSGCVPTPAMESARSSFPGMEPAVCLTGPGVWFRHPGLAPCPPSRCFRTRRRQFVGHPRGHHGTASRDRLFGSNRFGCKVVESGSCPTDGLGSSTWPVG